MNKQVPKYECYKDSGEDWIGDVPSHWEVVPIRSIFKFRNEKNDPVITDNILSLSIAHGVTEYSEEGRGGNKRKDDLSAYKIARPGDIVMNSMNVIVGAVGLSKYFGAISPVYYALYTEHDEADINYYERVFQNDCFQKGLLKFGKGILIKLSGTGKLNTIRMKVSTDDLKTLSFPKPPHNEQIAIVNFLDEKTSQIDEVIAIKQKQIELLKERKQIIIQQAVTQGLNPDVPMKDSGVDWIGQIPEHWSVLSNRRILNSIEQGSSPAMQNNIEAGEYSVLKLSAIKFGEFQSHESKPITKKQYDPRYQISNGDFLVTRGNTLELVADSCVVYGLQCQKVMLSDLIYRLNFDLSRVDLGFLLAFFQSPLMREQIKKSARGSSSTMPKVSQEHIKSWLLLLPPIEEQALISNYLNLELSKISKATELQQRQIDNLKEYKTTLINSAVTGKIKVTELA
ncbi:MAG: restriction endonuclease subunit S [Pseudomonadota bacterium]